MKTCTKCGVEKSLTQFNKDKNNKDGKTYYCKECAKLKSKLNYSKNRITRIIKQKAYNKVHREKITERQRGYSKTYREKIAEYNREYGKTHKAEIGRQKKDYSALNRGKINAIAAKRHTQKLQATTDWSEYSEIRKLYERAAEMRAEGQDVHVDHIVPLQSKIVCGLHVIANLQILGAVENIKKGNKHVP